jgi:hypothetical protein
MWVLLFVLSSNFGRFDLVSGLHGMSLLHGFTWNQILSLPSNGYNLQHKLLSAPPYLINILADCKSLLQRQWQVKLDHVCREADGCADC